jgi:hypothetical protein
MPHASWHNVRKSQRRTPFPAPPQPGYNPGMRDAIMGTLGTAWIALAIWFVVRVVNRQESWVMAAVILGIAAAAWAGLLIGLTYLLKGC